MHSQPFCDRGQGRLSQRNEKRKKRGGTLGRKTARKENRFPIFPAKAVIPPLLLTFNQSRSVTTKRRSTKANGLHQTRTASDHRKSSAQSTVLQIQIFSLKVGNHCCPKPENRKKTRFLHQKIQSLHAVGASLHQEKDQPCRHQICR